VGGGIEGSIQKNVESSGAKVFAEGSVALGPIGAGLGGDISLDCLEATGKASVQAGFHSVEVNTNGELTGKVGGEAEAGVKAGIKGCWRW
jgi:hypothetical protein